MECKVVKLEHGGPKGCECMFFFQKKYFLKILNFLPDFVYTVVGDTFIIIRQLDF